MPYQIPSLTGRTILITGGNAGIGASVVQALAAHGPSKIYIAGRRLDVINSFIASLADQYPKVTFLPLSLDLASLSSVRTCAQSFLSQESHLNLLFLNAGVAFPVDKTTSNGYETCIGVNHLGHALLTQLLMPTLLRTTQDSSDTDVRVIVTTSAACRLWKPHHNLSLDELRSTDWINAQSRISLESRSKFANTLFASKLARLYPQILCTSVLPGFVSSGITDGGGVPWHMRLILTVARPLFGVSCEEGAKALIWVGTVQKEELVQGGYYQPDGQNWAVKQAWGRENMKDMEDELWEWTNRELAQYCEEHWPAA